MIHICGYISVLLFIVKIISGRFTIEEPKLPYYANINFGEGMGGDQGSLTIEEENAYGPLETTAEVHVMVTFNDSKFSELVGLDNDPANSLVLKTKFGRSYVRITYIPGLPESNETRMVYTVKVDSKVERVELFETLLEVFAPKSSYYKLQIYCGNAFKVTKTMLEAVTHLGKQFKRCILGFGQELPKPELLAKFVETARPSSLVIRLGGIDDECHYGQPPPPPPSKAAIQSQVLHDAFFRNDAIRNLTDFQLSFINATISDDSLDRLRATDIRMRAMLNITAGGILNWLKPVMNGSVEKKLLQMTPTENASTVPKFVVELETHLNHTQCKDVEGKGDVKWTIGGFKNESGTFNVTLTFLNFTDEFKDRSFVLTAKTELIEGKGTQSSISSFVLLAASLAMKLFV